ncbi:hypothetical protein JNUCC0626_18260 [Lentzea sp. JNUCC 0626]|uniref:hypothetical protein n=1 Tax=Lentzea sp. JNUCC 0626 TaxID=3367513 RepID=UPI0037496F8A
MTGAELVPILVAVISAGVLRDVVRWFGARRKARSPEGKQAASLITVDQSIAVVARARDELMEDNVRLREQLAETDARHAAERVQWAEEKASMRAEITGLERRLRELLTEVEDLKIRHS